MAGSVVGRFLTILGGRVGSLLLSLLITPLLVRFLGSSMYGDYAVVLSVLTIALIFVDAGIFDGIRKYISENRNIDRWEEQVFGFYFRLAILFSVIIAGLISLFTLLGVTNYIFGPEFDEYFYILSGLIIATQLFLIVRGALMGFGQERRSEPLVVLETALYGLFGVGLVYFGYGVVGVLMGHLLALLVVVLFGFMFVREYVPLSKSFQLTDSNFPRRELISFNGLSIVLIFLMSTLIEVDILLLQPLAGSDQTGYYKAALVLAEFVWFVPAVLQTLLLQTSSEISTKNQPRHLTLIASWTTRFSLLLTLLLVLGLAALADVFIPLYLGQEFSRTTIPLLLLLPGTLGFALARPILAIGQGMGSLYPLIKATSIAAFLNLILNLLLIPQYGMYGAAVATSIGYGSMLLLHIRAAHQIGFDPVADLRLVSICVTALLSAPVIFGLTVILPEMVALLVVPPVGFIVYLSLAIKFNAVDSEEILLLLKMTSREGV